MTYPVATIDLVYPARASEADTIAFTGHGNLPALPPATYAWSANGALLSNAAAFSKSGFDFPRGGTIVVFWVQAPNMPELRLWSKFDETSGRNAYDSSGRGNTGALTGFTVATVFDAAGKFNGCINQSREGEVMYGSGVEYTGAAVADLNITGDLTIALWVKPRTVTYPHSPYWLVTKQRSTGYNRTYSLYLTGTTPQLVIGNATATAWLCVITGVPISLDEWHFIAVKRNAATGAAKMRVDDVWYDASTALPGLAFSTVDNYKDRLMVGNAYEDYDRELYGRLDDLRICASVLTDDTVDAIYINSTNGPVSDPVGANLIVGRYPPDAFVDAWPGAGPFPHGTRLYFEGHGESELNITAFEWYSSRDGYFSSDFRCMVETLSAGSHDIFFYAYDERGQNGNAYAGTLVITAPPSPPPKPVAIIYWPYDGYLMVLGDSLWYYGYGGSSGYTTTHYEWQDSLTGLIFSTQGQVWEEWIATLPGVHTFRFKLMAGGVWSDQDTARIYVVGKPTPSITTFPTSPQTIEYGDTGIVLNFAGTGTAYFAAILGHICTAFEWSSDLQGVLSNSTSFSTDTLTVGTHQISFKVMDENGVWSDPLTMPLTILAFIQPYVPPPDPALDTFQSSVRLETWKNQRTRRGQR